MIRRQIRFLLTLAVAVASFAASTNSFQYDLIIIGGGASGMFAAGSASSIFGKKTAIIDLKQELGGDCTNAACVPSKALRSAVRRSGVDKLDTARSHVLQTVQAVRNRENIDDMLQRNPNLDVHLVRHCRFVGRHELELLTTSNETAQVVTSRKFLLATGAGPVVPPKWKDEAKQAENLPLWTYRDILQPEETSFWDAVKQGKLKRLLIAGGGATACELGQALGRLFSDSTVEVELVAPAILPEEDEPLQQAGLKILQNVAVACHLGDRIKSIQPDRSVRLESGKIMPPFDGILVCIGRKPQLESLDLDRAGIAWDAEQGVLVNTRTLQSKTARHVYAAGDCASAVRGGQRNAAHGAWTGFHAVRNLYVPAIFRLASPATHPWVPRVIYTDPELARVGLTHAECVQRYATDTSFRQVTAQEEGSDRADMERGERDTTLPFVQIRATPNGRLLGVSTCGPAAAELVNSMGMALTNGLTVQDVARSIHSYPSYSYLLHRVALSMALSSVPGLLGTLGPIGRVLGAMWFFFQRFVNMIQSFVRLVGQSKGSMKREV